MHHVADVGGVEVDPQVRREAVLHLAQDRGLALLLELFLARDQQPHTALEPLPQRRDEGLQLEHALAALVDVLADLVHHQEQRRVRGAEAEHVGDGPGGVVGRKDPAARAAARAQPALRIGVLIGEEMKHHLGEVVVGKLLVPGLLPGSVQDLFGLRQETIPVGIPLQAQLELGHQGVAAVAQALLDLAHHGGVDVLVVAGNTADVEHAGHGVDPADQVVPGRAELVELG